MRSVVAIVETRPETIQQDYQRVLSLAKIPRLVYQPTAQDPLSVMVGGAVEKPQPGFGATPWQLNGVLSFIQSFSEESLSASHILSVSDRGCESFGQSFLNPMVVSHFGARLADSAYLRPHRHQSGLLHPALDQILSNGVQLPVGTAAANGLLLTAPSLSPQWGVSGAVSMLHQMVMNGTKAARGTSAAELKAESLAVAMDVMPNLCAVLDGTLWGMSRENSGKHCFARNVLIAGNDPLAVDVVAMRLAGVDPSQVAWVRHCLDHNIGSGRPEEINVVGRTDLLDLDFELGGGTFGASDPSGFALPALGPLAASVRSVRDWIGGRAGARESEGRFKDSVWAELWAEYTAGTYDVRQKKEIHVSE